MRLSNGNIATRSPTPYGTHVTNDRATAPPSPAGRKRPLPKNIAAGANASSVRTNPHEYQHEHQLLQRSSPAQWESRNTNHPLHQRRQNEGGGGGSGNHPHGIPYSNAPSKQPRHNPYD